jgi:kynurenine formamidase
LFSLIQYDGAEYEVDLSTPLDISIPLRAGTDNVNAFFAKPVSIQPYESGSFIGEISQGGSVNFMDIFLNPHGNGTHTECVGHISPFHNSLNQCLKKFLFPARLISIEPVKKQNDLVLPLDKIKSALGKSTLPALVIRTLPNSVKKLNQQYSGNNPPYFEYQALKYLSGCGVKHLLTDLPSVDREQDEGALLAHKAFWHYPEKTRTDCTITELIYVENSIRDGLYFLNLMISSLENDASPSKPVLYPVVNKSA